MGITTRSDNDTAPADLLAELLGWYDRHRRDLPWRAAAGRRPDPYQVMLSEFMLQQTTVATVARRFNEFIARFPDFATLAAATEAEVLHAWQGLGYYRRARALHACARAVLRDHGGALPESEAALLALPGIGPYTARAVRAIAFDEPAVPVDGNVLRVMARLHGVEAPLPGAAGELQELAAAFETAHRPGDVAQALMDLGATVCRPQEPRCMDCPWQMQCRARAAGTTALLPRRQAKRTRPVRRGVAFLLVRPDGAILFRRRPPDGLLGGMHELPTTPWHTGPLDLDAAWQHAPMPTNWQLDAEPVSHGFTHFRLELTLARATADVCAAGEWCRPDRLHRLALPTLTRKLLRRAGYDVPSPIRGQ